MDKDVTVELIGKQARRKVAVLSTKFARARSEDKEEILAEMEFERELADICDAALD